MTRRTLCVLYRKFCSQSHAGGEERLRLARLSFARDLDELEKGLVLVDLLPSVPESAPVDA